MVGNIFKNIEYMLHMQIETEIKCKYLLVEHMSSIFKNLFRIGKYNAAMCR